MVGGAGDLLEEGLRLGEEAEDLPRADTGETLPIVDVDDFTWDSTERRDAQAAIAQRAGVDPETIGMWKLADVDQAKHPREAVTGKPATSSKPFVPEVERDRQLEREGR